MGSRGDWLYFQGAWANKLGEQGDLILIFGLLGSMGKKTIGEQENLDSGRRGDWPKNLREMGRWDPPMGASRVSTKLQVKLSVFTDVIRRLTTRL